MVKPNTKITINHYIWVERDKSRNEEGRIGMYEFSVWYWALFGNFLIFSTIGGSAEHLSLNKNRWWISLKRKSHLLLTNFEKKKRKCGCGLLRALEALRARSLRRGN